VTYLKTARIVYEDQALEFPVDAWEAHISDDETEVRLRFAHAHTEGGKDLLIVKVAPVKFHYIPDWYGKEQAALLMRFLDLPSQRVLEVVRGVLEAEAAK
jgi:hypothetical protein